MIFFKLEFLIGITFCLLLFWGAIPERFRTKFIIAISTLVLALIQLKFTLFLFGLIYFVYRGARLIETAEKKLRKLALYIVILTIVLFGFKYAGVLFAMIFSGENAFSAKYLAPLGLSYMCFKMIAFVIDVYRGTIKDPGLEEFIAFIVFIPMFPAGPIEKYQNFAGSRKPAFESDFFMSGVQRIIIGYFKKVVLVNLLLNEIVNKWLYPIVTADGVSMSLSAGVCIAYVVGALLYAYLDISSYADLAIGYGKLFGYSICENMNYPLFRQNLSDYWNSWHMSLSFWCRDNVYFPVLGKTRNINLALYASFLVMGLWHYLSLNWAFWGLWHATGLIIFSKWSRFKRKKKLKGFLPEKLGYALGMIITVLYASFGYSFVFLDKPIEALRLLAAIFI